ncbi:nitrous oxide reductase family maturation protein NosD [Membranicola marinus]|uniref:Nitrous oxide reductase family maturation protein NosD n=1 Tax=Membranihabitans marinus TaxID=1227546 RepID=A0A953LEG1_9BACT|nr:nitrous oxide reductase family maturation protein NosD [Membranihabitans marinus]
MLLQKHILDIFIFALSTLFVGQLRADTIEVCATCPVTTLQAGIDQASPYDTVQVAAGTYPEYNIVINKPLYLLGIGQPIIDGENKGEIVQITSDSVTLDGFVIRHVETSYTKDHAAIRIIKSRDFILQNLILEDFLFGIYLQKSHHGIIRNNYLNGHATNEFGSGNGIHLWYAQHVLIEGNEIEQARDGIYFEFADSCVIRNNYSHHNIRYGLHFMFSNHDQYERNTFEQNGAGVAVMFSKHIDMRHNTFMNNWGASSYGLLLKEINDAEIIGNKFIKNTIGINVEGTNRINYQNNEFKDNGWALKIRGAIYTNVFTKNNFLHNSFDLSYNSNLNDNVFEKNYWSNYTGYDLDRDGLGDVPFRPVNLFSYIVNKTPETIILLRSLFMDLIDFSEKVSPVFTPDNLMDPTPLMKPFQSDLPPD